MEDLVKVAYTQAGLRPASNYVKVAAYVYRSKSVAAIGHFGDDLPDIAVGAVAMNLLESSSRLFPSKNIDSAVGRRCRGCEAASL